MSPRPAADEPCAAAAVLCRTLCNAAASYGLPIRTCASNTCREDKLSLFTGGSRWHNGAASLTSPCGIPTWWAAVKTTLP